MTNTAPRNALNRLSEHMQRTELTRRVYAANREALERRLASLETVRALHGLRRLLFASWELAALNLIVLFMVVACGVYAWVRPASEK